MCHHVFATRERFSKLKCTSQFPLCYFLPIIPKCFVQCVCINMYILEIDITSETSFRNNVLAFHSYFWCEVYGTIYFFLNVCQIWIKALVRNYGMYGKHFWLEKLTLSYLSQCTLPRPAPCHLAAYFPSLLPHFSGCNNSFIASYIWNSLAIRQ